MGLNVDKKPEERPGRQKPGPTPKIITRVKPRPRNFDYDDPFESMGPVLNVLTRTCNRPNRFRRCSESIKAQETNILIRHFVSIDRPCTYVDADVLVPAIGNISPDIPEGHRQHRDAPYNLYVNDLLSAVKSGWIFVLDDDDELLHEKAVSLLEPYMNDEDNLIVFKFAMGDGKGEKHFVMPKYHDRSLVLNDVPCSCYIYHSKHKEYGLWHAKYAGDFYAADNLSRRLKTIWVDEVLAGTQEGPNIGAIDIKRYKPWVPRIIKEESNPVFLSIVIPVLNQSHYTELILEQIRNTVHIPHEVIVIDNGSTDDTSEILKKSGAIVIRNETNMGVSFAWNQGCKKARGTHIAILNNDLVLPDRWAENLLSHKEHVICPMYQQFGEVKKDFDALNARLESQLPGVKIAQRPGLHPRGFAGFCFILSREAWERVGVFDEDYRYWFGDNDYWLRLKDMGYQPVMSQNVEVHHFVRQTSDQLEDFEEQREKDHHRFLVKWPKGLKEC